MQGGIIARLGWEECKKYPGYTPIAAGLYCEAWQSKAPVNDEYKMQPKNDPKRHEIIMVETWHTEEQKVETYRLSVIRDHKKRVVDLGPAEGPKNSMSMLFASFLQGIRDSQKPDEKTFGRMEGMLSKRIARLSPEQRQELRTFAFREGIPADLLNELMGKQDDH